jgi:hypothetical protein
MNERIKALAVEADFMLCEDGHFYSEGQSQKTTDQLQKFAELIVRECAELFADQKYMILNPHEPFANERVRALKEHDKDTVRKIKQHFGVRE